MNKTDIVNIMKSELSEANNAEFNFEDLAQEFILKFENVSIIILEDIVKFFEINLSGDIWTDFSLVSKEIYFNISKS